MPKPLRKLRAQSSASPAAAPLPTGPRLAHTSLPFHPACSSHACNTSAAFLPVSLALTSPPSLHTAGKLPTVYRTAPFPCLSVHLVQHCCRASLAPPDGASSTQAREAWGAAHSLPPVGGSLPSQTLAHMCVCNTSVPSLHVLRSHPILHLRHQWAQREENPLSHVKMNPLCVLQDQSPWVNTLLLFSLYFTFFPP